MKPRANRPRVRLTPNSGGPSPAPHEKPRGQNMIYELVFEIEIEKIVEKIIIQNGYIVNRETGEVVGQVFTY